MESSERLTGRTVLLFAVASGLAVANAYFAHPLLDAMADELGLPRSAAGLIVGATQIGYGVGLLLLVPLGDLLDRRQLIIGHFLLSVLALASVGWSWSAPMLLSSMAAVGLLAVVTQSLVAYAASLARPFERGQVVGSVTSGIVIGILLARTAAGVITDLAGWRAVYLASALLTFVLALLLWMVLPRQRRAPPQLGYGTLIVSLPRLILDEPALLIRGLIGVLIFANITTLLTPLVLPMSAPPHLLSHTQVGLFGLAGAAGALGASRAGRWTDRGHGQRTTGLALALMLLSWPLIALLEYSILWLVLGVVIIDFGLQAAHVTNQAMIYRVRPEAQNRLTAAYMIFYSLGSAVGSSASTLVYAHAGWLGVCAMGGAISLLALMLWGLTLHLMPLDTTQRLGVEVGGSVCPQFSERCRES